MKKLFVLVSMLLLFSNLPATFGEDNSLDPQDLSVSFRLPPEEELWPGDVLYIYVDVNNPSEVTFKDIPLFVIWTFGNDWDDSIYYWPIPENGEWIPNEVNYYDIDVPPGVTEVEVVAPMLSPDPAGEFAATLHLVTAMTNPFMTRILGVPDWRTIYIHF